MTQQRKTEIIVIIIIELSFSCGACHRCIMYWCFACNLALCATAVSLVSFNCSTAAVPVAQTEVQATGTGTSDTATVSRRSAYIEHNQFYNTGAYWARITSRSSCHLVVVDFKKKLFKAAPLFIALYSCLMRCPHVNKVTIIGLCI